jgi:hypothetical protein
VKHHTTSLVSKREEGEGSHMYDIQGHVLGIMKTTTTTTTTTMSPLFLKHNQCSPEGLECALQLRRCVLDELQVLMSLSGKHHFIIGLALQKREERGKKYEETF